MSDSPCLFLLSTQHWKEKYFRYPSSVFHTVWCSRLSVHCIASYESHYETIVFILFCWFGFGFGFLFFFLLLFLALVSGFFFVWQINFNFSNFCLNPHVWETCLGFAQLEQSWWRISQVCLEVPPSRQKMKNGLLTNCGKGFPFLSL